jgi:hypothetical protein
MRKTAWSLLLAGVLLAIPAGGRAQAPGVDGRAAPTSEGRFVLFEAFTSGG